MFKTMVVRQDGCVSVVVSDEEGERVARFELSTRPRAAVGVHARIDPARDGQMTLSCEAGVHASASIFSETFCELVCPDGVAREVVTVECAASESVDGPLTRWALWAARDTSDFSTPRWRRGSFFLWSALFGEAQMDERPVRSVVVEVPLPEGPYEGVAEVREYTYTRPRWPGEWLRLRRVGVSVATGVPIPPRFSANRNAHYDTSGPGEDIAGMIGRFVAHVLRSRECGGDGWAPHAADSSSEAGE